MLTKSDKIDCGAQVLQVFESWAHHLSPEDFLIFGKPYADKAISLIKQKACEIGGARLGWLIGSLQHPDVPIIYFANGGSSYLELQRDMKVRKSCSLQDQNIDSEQPGRHDLRRLEGIAHQHSDFKLY